MRGIDAHRRIGMLSVHFRRIALAQGLLATSAEKSPSADAKHAAPHREHEDAAGEAAALPHPESRETA
jgi:hypothetical protein